MRQVKVFISSPGDAITERKRIRQAITRLNARFGNTIALQPILWEESFYKAHSTFQEQIPEARDCDIVLAVFKTRLGTPLPDSFPKMPDGQSYPSGTAYEVLSAIEKRKAGAVLPDVFVFRQDAPKLEGVRFDEQDVLAAKQKQWKLLSNFFETFFVTS